MTATVVIVQPYIPAYRVPFFDGLQQKLAEVGVSCLIAAGRPQGEQAQRGDATEPDWLLRVDRKMIRVRSRELTLAMKPTPWKNVDAVIMGLEGSSLPVYQALIASRVYNFRVGLWGHVRPYVSPGNSLDLWLENRQMRMASHIFAYMPGGTRFAVDHGILSEKVTTVMNTVDTSALADALKDTTTQDVESFSQANAFDPNRAVCFLGGLDSSKRVDFLAETLEKLWALDQSISLLVAGRGSEEYLLEDAYNRGQACSLGFVDTQKKALTLKSTRAVCMPGRIGLVAVDALVAQLPVITTDWPFHAPEVEYLTEGTTRFTTPDDPLAYAEAIVRRVDEPAMPNITAYPKLDDMIDNFADGVIKMLS